MRLRLVTVAILLAVASRGDGRPKHPDPLDGSSSTQEVNVGSPDSRQEQHREVKNIHNMDQSLRTVATQLLNATAKREDLIRIPEEQIVTVDSPMQIVHISTQVEDVDTEINKEDSNSGKMKFGIPVNSKFGNFELSNPGQAMAMTEEEIEREMATATAATRQKPPTTTSMFSTWIQLYPPSTTTHKPLSEEKIDSQKNNVQTSTSTKSVPVKSTTTGKPIRKAETKQTTKFVGKTTEASTPTPKVTQTITSTTTNFVKISTTTVPTSIENDVKETLLIEKKPLTQRTTASVSTTAKSAPVTKKPSKSTTPKSNSTTQKSPTSKPSRTNNPNRIKPFSSRRPPINKSDTVTSTSKIEKVTIKPATTFAQNVADHTEKTSFFTKIKASMLSDAQKPTTPTPAAMNPINSILSKSNFTNVESSHIKVPTPAKVNNVLKVHLKKPIDDTTKIEIQPIRVNPPVLTIEKIEDTSSDQKVDNEEKEILENSKIDVKFDFDPEVSTFQVQTQSVDSTLSPTTTTKKPRTSNKRKRNKNRRRKPTTTTSISTTTTLAPVSKPAEDDDTTSIDDLDLEDLLLSGIQESKIEPESKAPPSKKKKPNQTTQVQKPIGTQIYNFLSREVMPSVGVMSLVGLGLGLASYFLYPFGGGITRRNYEVEPNYKYNLDEYGGNYGLSEEEVLSKVYSGMTNNQNHDTKYSNVGVVGEKNSNYYKYSAPEQQSQQQPTRYPTPASKPHKNRVIYRPVETTSYDVNYRNTEFKYPDVPTTPNYYERQRQQQQQQQQQQQSSDFVPSIGKVGVGNNRQFVVGNVPKEYSSSETDKLLDILPMQDKAEASPQYQADAGPEYQADASPQYQADESFPNQDIPISPMLVPENLKNLHPEALVGKIDEIQSAASYDDLEMNPSAVAIEHGPRALKSSIRRKRGIIPDILPINIPGLIASRKERSSVIQVIPSKSQIEKERKKEEREEDLSNEILDIIDDAIPGQSDNQKKRHDGKDSMMKHHTMDSDGPLKISIKSAAITTAAPTTTTAKSTSTSSTTTTTTTAATSTTEMPTEPDFVDQEPTTLDWKDNVSTTAKPQTQRFDIIAFARKIAEIKLKVGLTILKHASEGFARYIGDVQKKLNKEE